jgi:hypothetical protein
MTEANPVLFYFWKHSRKQQLRTKTLENLVRRADIVFQEGVTEDLELTRAIERDLNTYIRTRKIPRQLQRAFDTEELSDNHKYLAGLMHGTGKRMKLERTIFPNFDYKTEAKGASVAFLLLDLETAHHLVEEFLEMAETYQEKREKKVAKQIVRIPKTTAVIFGAAHTELAKIVSRYRPVEIHYPYPGYITSYSTIMSQAYRQTKKLDMELFIRFNMESKALKAIEEGYRNKLDDRQIESLANFYASIMTQEQIIEFRDYLLSCSSLIIGMSDCAIFESYLKRRALPTIEEAVGKLNKQKKD